jgi:serine/threonine-protein kinase RIO1
LSSDHNQRIGFERYGKTAHGREEYKGARDAKIHLSEVKIADASRELLDSHLVSKIHSIIGGGKEATVLLAEDLNGELVCAKVFRYFTSTIKKRLKGTKHLLASDMAAIAAKQEFFNLKALMKHSPVPKPLYLLDNIVIMEFISENPSSSFSPAPLIRDVDLSQFDPEEILYSAIDILAQIFLKSNMIHGDYSEHNLMIQTHSGCLYTMDVSQSVEYNQKTFINTPVRIRIDKAVEMLDTDLRNINQFFKRIYRISIDPTEVKDSIIAELPSKLQNFLSEKTMDIYSSELISNSLIGKSLYRDRIVEERSGTRRQSPK